MLRHDTLPDPIKQPPPLDVLAAAVVVLPPPPDVTGRVTGDEVGDWLMMVPVEVAPVTP